MGTRERLTSATLLQWRFRRSGRRPSARTFCGERLRSLPGAEDRPFRTSPGPLKSPPVLRAGTRSASARATEDRPLSRFSGDRNNAPCPVVGCASQQFCFHPGLKPRAIASEQPFDQTCTLLFREFQRGFEERFGGRHVPSLRWDLAPENCLMPLTTRSCARHRRADLPSRSSRGSSSGTSSRRRRGGRRGAVRPPCARPPSPPRARRRRS